MPGPTTGQMTGPLQVTLTDDFWAPRQRQLRDHTLDVLRDRFEEHGILDTFHRLGRPEPRGRRRGLWFSDSDVYKWMEAAAWAGRLDLLEPMLDAVALAARADGYVHTFYDVGPGSQDRYVDLGTSHEWYCAGHLTEAALAHHAVTGDDALLDIARRWADHLCATFGPGRDERVDGHPEAELALARLAERTGESRYLDQARWIIEHLLATAGLSIETVDLSGHAVKSLYLASGIAEVARATGDPRWRDAVERLFTTLVEERSYPTGGVGGRWLDEAVGRPHEMPDAASYTESCAAVASVQFCRRAWDLLGDPRALDQIEVLLYNAVPCGVGADGASWFYSQPHAVAEVRGETNPWALPFEYGQQMLLQWFPARRHEWFDVMCCPPNLARMFATVDHHVADLDEAGGLRIHLPLSCRIRGGGWDVTIDGAYPEGGTVHVQVDAAPAAPLSVRVAGWAGGPGHVALPPDGDVEIDAGDRWWESSPRVEGAAGTVFLRRGPVVCCVEGIDRPDLDVGDLVVDPGCPTATAFARAPDRDQPLHRPVRPDPPAAEPVGEVALVPYHSWANRGLTTMRYRFPRR